MSERLTVARPYAKAAFEYAKAQGSVELWLGFFEALAKLVKLPDMAEYLAMPMYSLAHKHETLVGCFGEQLSQAQSRFIFLLLDSKRIKVCPEMLALFSELKAKDEAVIPAKLWVAHSVDTSVEQQVSQALANRLQTKVVMTAEADASLIGGAKVQVGDTVIDGSVRGHLHQLAANLGVQGLVVGREQS